MSNLVDHVVKLTQHRDRDQLDITLTDALMSLLNPQRVSIVGVVSEEQEQHWLPLTQLERGGVAEVLAEPMRVNVQNLQRLEDEPNRLQCLNSLLQLEVVPDVDSQPHMTFFPLFPDSRATGQGVIEIHSDTRLTAEAVHAVQRLLSVYRNMRDMLDYSECDALTGLLNRKSFDDAFFKVLREDRAESGGRVQSAADLAGLIEHRRPDQAAGYWLAMVDVDHFKQVNDVHGHSIGDEVLLLVARILKTTFRALDRVYRFGGEEFVVLLSCPDEQAAMQALERFRSNMENYAFPQVGRITASVGFAEIHTGDSPSVACARADQAVYFAKKNGRNRVCSYDGLIREGLLQTDNKVGGIELF